LIEDTDRQVVGQGHGRVVDTTGTPLTRLTGVPLGQTELVELPEGSRWKQNEPAEPITPPQVRRENGLPDALRQRVAVVKVGRIKNSLKYR
jgi:hypothetical protein